MAKTDMAKTTSDEVSLKDLVFKVVYWWKYLVAKWAIIVVVGLIGGGIGFTYAKLNDPIYNATLSFALEDDQGGGGLGAAMGLASQFGVDLGGGGASGVFSGSNLPELMKSRSVVESTLLTPVNVNGKQVTLAELYITFKGLRKKWSNMPGLSNVQFLPHADRTKFTLQQDSLLGEFYKKILRENLFVDKVDKNLSIISVKVSSTSELFSKYFTEVLTKTVSDFYVATKTKKSVQNVNILQHQTDSVRRELNAALTGVAASADVNPNANPALQILRVPSQRRQVDVQANQAILTQLVANLEISKVALRKETPLIQVIDRPILPLEKDRISGLKSLILGGVLAGFFAIVFFICKRLYKDLISN